MAGELCLSIAIWLVRACRGPRTWAAAVGVGGQVELAHLQG